MIATMRLGDVGTVIELALKEYDASGNLVTVDVSGASTKQIVLQRDGDASATKTAQFTTDGTDGKVQYTVQNGDISATGRWRAEAYIVTPSGSWRSTQYFFDVVDPL